MSRLGTLFAAICLVATSCYPDPLVQPPWIAKLMPKLQCGMSLVEVQALTSRKVDDLGGGHRFFGTHRISTKWHDLWFGFDAGQLRTVAWGAAENSKSTRLSPRHDVCDGQLAFFVRVTWTEPFVGSDVYLDGRLIAAQAQVAPLLEMSAGQHELRIEKPGFGPIVRTLSLAPSDRGDQSIYIDSAMPMTANPNKRE